MRIARATALALGLALPGCSDGPTAPAGEVLQLIVLEAKVECQAEARMECLQVIEPPDLQPRVFYEDIEGFSFQRGVRQTIVVERFALTNPPIDGSSYRYRLIRVVDRLYLVTPAS